MQTKLNAKEQKVLERFSKHGLELIETQQVSFTGKGMIFNIQEPVVYKIADSDSILIFGEPRKSMSMEELKRWWLEQQDRTNKQEENVPEEIEGELDGEEAHSGACGSGCTHGHAEEMKENKAPGDPNIKEDDVQLVMSQVNNISREDAIEALKNSKYDVVNALVDLTTKNK